MNEEQAKADQKALERFYRACASQGTDPKTIRDPARYMWAWDRVRKRFKREVALKKVRAAIKKATE